MACPSGKTCQTGTTMVTTRLDHRSPLGQGHPKALTSAEGVRSFRLVPSPNPPRMARTDPPTMVRSHVRIGLLPTTNALRRHAEGVLLGHQGSDPPSSPGRPLDCSVEPQCCRPEWPAWGIAFAPAWGIPRRRRPATSLGVLGRAHIERYSRSGALLIRRDSYLRLGTIRANEQRPSILTPLRRCSPAAAIYPRASPTTRPTGARAVSRLDRRATYRPPTSQRESASAYRACTQNRK